MLKTGLIALTVISAGIACAAPASAHFRLLKPVSWLKEDSAGGPQKAGPCGVGGYDNVNPIPTSGAVTTFKAGETITVEWVDTIAHPGYFRIALAANRDDFQNPTIVQDATCNFDESMVPTGAHGNVLADGVAFRTRVKFAADAGTPFSQEVTLPKEPCDKCTLQVMQVMEMDIKLLSNCYYFHCADIRIVPDDGADMGDAGVSGTVTYEDASAPMQESGIDAGLTAPGGDGTPAGSAGNPDAGTSGSTGNPTGANTGGTPAASSNNGCSVAVGNSGTSGLAFLGTALGLVTLARRRRARRT